MHCGTSLNQSNINQIARRKKIENEYVDRPCNMQCNFVTEYHYESLLRQKSKRNQTQCWLKSAYREIGLKNRKKGYFGFISRQHEKLHTSKCYFRCLLNSSQANKPSNNVVLWNVCLTTSLVINAMTINKQPASKRNEQYHRISTAHNKFQTIWSIKFDR